MCLSFAFELKQMFLTSLVYLFTVKDFLVEIVTVSSFITLSSFLLDHLVFTLPGGSLPSNSES